MVRGEIYEAFGKRGVAPTPREIAVALHATTSEVGAALLALFDAHEIAPFPDGGGVWMANPFSAVETDYPVETPHMKCFANCAWDALGVPAILETDGWTRTRCANSGEPLEFGVRDGQLEAGPGLIHLVTPPRDAWKDIGFT